jgi:hypothetical protein
MPVPNEIADDEMILRRIPQRVPEAKARHFKLREGETGLSCNRKIQMQPEDMLKGEVPKGSWVAESVVNSIRNLGLQVEIDEVEDSPGHCEIRSEASSLEEIDVRDRLAKVFSEAFRPVDTE